MTVERLLVGLYGHRASLSVHGDRLRVEAPSRVLTSGLRQALVTHKPRLVRLVGLINEYRILLHSDIDETSFLQAQARLIDELGPAVTSAVRESVEREVRRDLRHA